MNTLRCLAPLAVVAGLAAGAQAQSITTLFAGGNGGSSGWTNYFDVTVTNPAGLRLTSLVVHLDSAAGTAFTVDLYVTAAGGTHVGNTGTPGVWTQVSTGAGTSAGSTVGTQSPVDVSDFILAPGTYGFAIRYLGTGMRYTNGTGTNQNYSNADIALTLGQARSTTAPFTGGGVFSPRVWNGTINYEVVPTPGSVALLGMAGLLAARRRR